MRTLARFGIFPLTVLIVSCAVSGRGHHIDFSRLNQADRLVVRTRAGDTVKTITDPGQVTAAAQFIQRYESGWKDPLQGPLVPDFMLHFYVGNRGLGGYGIASGAVVSDPPTSGFWSRSVPGDGLNRLASALGLKLGVD